MDQQTFSRFIELVISTAQAGLAYSKDRYDIDRFNKLRLAAAEIISEAGGVPASQVRDWLALDRDYPTPKLDVRAMILDDKERVLLVREESDGLWTLPGGWCDIGESPSEAVVREVLEETGLVVSPVRLLALFDKLKHPHPPQIPQAHKAFFLCSVQGGCLSRKTDETTAADFFDVAQLPDLSENRVLKAQIQVLHERVRGGAAETLFD